MSTTVLANDAESLESTMKPDDEDIKTTPIDVGNSATKRFATS